MESINGVSGSDMHASEQEFGCRSGGFAARHFFMSGFPQDRWQLVPSAPAVSPSATLRQSCRRCRIALAKAFIGTKYKNLTTTQKVQALFVGHDVLDGQ